MVTYERLSYAVEDSTMLSELQEWIERDTNIPVRDQELLLGNGQRIDMHGAVSQCLNGNSQVSTLLQLKDM